MTRYVLSLVDTNHRNTGAESDDLFFLKELCDAYTRDAIQLWGINSEDVENQEWGVVADGSWYKALKWHGGMPMLLFTIFDRKSITEAEVPPPL